MTTPTTTIAETDYCAIEDALQATEKGPRFLRAYVERNRSLDSQAAPVDLGAFIGERWGEPGLNAEIGRDLSAVLRSVSKHRQAAIRCSDASSRSAALEHSLEEVESPDRPRRVHRGKGFRGAGRHDCLALRGPGRFVPRRALRAAVWRVIFLFFNRSTLTCRIHSTEVYSPRSRILLAAGPMCIIVRAGVFRRTGHTCQGILDI